MITYHTNYYHVYTLGGYEVEILISPTVGPYQLRNTINCSCSINPTPTVPVTYQWNIPRFFGDRTINRQNISYTPYEDDDLHFIWFYCNVSSGSSVVAQGKKLIEVHGELIDVELHVHEL